jgi:hypothetical protein
MSLSNPRSGAPSPPRWADQFLTTLLGPSQAETVSGDLLEEYRDSIHSTRGRSAANFWFVTQVARFAWHAVWIWAVAFATLQLGRDMLDWFIPPLDYTQRSVVTTYAAAAIFVALGFARAWRTLSLRSTALTALLAACFAAILKVAGILLVLGIWPGTETQNSGGLDEAIVLPWIVALPATMIAFVAGLVGRTAASVLRARSTR